jgi:glycosyltransferase involved in cell wall biosynthesis
MALRILMGVPAPGATGGGPALHLPMLVEDLRAAGHAVETFAFGRWAEGESLPRKTWHQLLDLARYPRIVRRSAPDLVHLNTSFDRKALVRDAPFALATRLAGKPLFLKWHGSEPELLHARAPWWRALVRLLFANTRAIGVLSASEQEAVRCRRDAPACHVVRNGLELARYAPRADIRSRHGIPAATPVLLFVSRLIAAKGLADVVRALPQVVARHDAHLVVVGDGPARAEAEALAAQLGIAARCHFTGRIAESEARDYYCGCDILVFPTYHDEGFPMTVFQSLAAGLGIVTTRIRATADYLREPDNALFVPPRDPAAVAAALARLLGDPPALAAMQAANRALARRFDRRTVAGEIAAIYVQMLEDR